MSQAIPYKSGEVINPELIVVLVVFFTIVLLIAFALKKYQPGRKRIIEKTDITYQSVFLSKHTVLHVVKRNDQEILLVESDKNITKLESL